MRHFGTKDGAEEKRRIRSPSISSGKLKVMEKTIFIYSLLFFFGCSRPLLLCCEEKKQMIDSMRSICIDLSLNREEALTQRRTHLHWPSSENETKNVRNEIIIDLIISRWSHINIHCFHQLSFQFIFCWLRLFVVYN